MTTHSSILASRIPWTEEPGGVQSMESQSDTTKCMHTHTYTHTHTFDGLVMAQAKQFTEFGINIRLPSKAPH